MSGAIFDSSILSKGKDFTRKMASLNADGVLRVKTKNIFSLKISQNSALHQTYLKLIQLNDSDVDKLKNLNFKELNHVFRFIEHVELKIGKSRKPHGLAKLLGKVYNAFARKFSFKQIEVYEYDNLEKVTHIKERLKKFIKETSPFDDSVLSTDKFSRKVVSVDKNGIFQIKGTKGLLPRISQNSNLYQTYEALKNIENLEKLKNLDENSLTKVKEFIEHVEEKVNKSRSPRYLAGVIVKTYNFFAKKFRFKEIQVYRYEEKEKLTHVKEKIVGFIAEKSKTKKHPFFFPAAHPKTASSSAPVTPPPSTISSTPPSTAPVEAKSSPTPPLSTTPVKATPSTTISPEYIDFVQDCKILEDLKKKKKWGDLLDRLKSYYQDDLQEEIDRLRKMGVLTEEILKKLNESIYGLEKTKSGETEHNHEMVKVAVARALEIKKYLGDEFWIVVTSNDPRWGMISYLNKELLRHQYKYKETHHFKFLRLPQDDKVDIATYRNSETHDHDATTRKALISCDTYFFSASQAESSLYFLSHATSISGWSDDTPIINAADENIRQIFPTLNATSFASIRALFAKTILEVKKTTPVGTLHVICVPKKEAIEGTHAYLYRAHPFGRVCDCYDASKERDILTDYQKDQLNFKCSSGYGYYGMGGAAQYRLLIPNVNIGFNEKKDSIFIKSFSGLDRDRRKNFKLAIRKILDGAGFIPPTGAAPLKLPRKKLPPATALSGTISAPLPPLVVNGDDSLSLTDYFEKSDKMNSQTSVTDLRLNILLGPQTLGFTDKLPMPFCAVSLEGKDLKRIKWKDDSSRPLEETPFGLVGGEPFPLFENDMIKLFDYDPKGVVRAYHEAKTRRRVKGVNGIERERGIEPSFSAPLSKKGKITLSKEECKLFKIDDRAKYFYFVKPVSALGASLATEAVEELRAEGLPRDEFHINEKKGKYIGDIIATLNEKYGPDFAALMYIGGYAYFDERDQLVQVKALVAKLTEDVLPIKKAQKNQGIIPEDIISEFNQSVVWMSNWEQNNPKDGNSTEITSPELLSYGATHFDWIPPGYMPKKAKDKGLEASYKTFYENHAPNGFFMYKFQKKPDLDCFLAIGVDPEEVSEGHLGNVTIMDCGKSKSVSALIEDECIVGPCRSKGVPNKSNVVWLTEKPGTKEQKYRQVACSDCNMGLSNEQRKRFYRQPVIAQYDLGVKLNDIKDQFYDALYLKPIANFKDAEISEMCSSKRGKIAGFSVAGATEFQFLYPAGKLAENTTDQQLKNLYLAGGYAYYNSYGQLVGIDELFISPEKGTVRSLPFEKLTEETAISDKVKKKFKSEIDKKKLPLVTIKPLRAKGIRHFMSIPPQDATFSTDKGMFLYISADGSTFFSKRVK